MSASLVGSEMCIRDRSTAAVGAVPAEPPLLEASTAAPALSARRSPRRASAPATLAAPAARRSPSDNDRQASARRAPAAR
eukprot:2476188-Alexandrium_andersonii.AAC.1